MSAAIRTLSKRERLLPANRREALNLLAHEDRAHTLLTWSIIDNQGQWGSTRLGAQTSIYQGGRDGHRTTPFNIYSRPLRPEIPFHRTRRRAQSLFAPSSDATPVPDSTKVPHREGPEEKKKSNPHHKSAYRSRLIGPPPIIPAVVRLTDLEQPSPTCSEIQQP